MAGRIVRCGLAAALLCMPLASVLAETVAETAARFGSRPTLEGISLSPDGTKLAMILPDEGRGSYLAVRDVADNAKIQTILRDDGKGQHFSSCHWVSNARLVCAAVGVVDLQARKMTFSRLFAIDIDGKNVVRLSTRDNSESYWTKLGGGGVTDWLPDEDGSILMTRVYTPDNRTGSKIGSTQLGAAVDRVNTMTLAVQQVEPPRETAAGFISDGRGNIRIEGLYKGAGVTAAMSGRINYLYRLKGSREWLPLSTYYYQKEEGFRPAAVDPDLNVAYGFKKKDGRQALYAVSLDGNLTEKLIHARSDVDLDGLARIGRRNRVVGLTFETDTPQVVYFDPEIRKIAAALGRAIPDQPTIQIIDSSVDERKLLIFAGSGSDPGAYYLFDRDKADLHLLFPARVGLEGRLLGTMSAIRYKAADGTEIPAYLTLPPGAKSVKGLPAIVMPHGGPSYRDSWGFDWLPQFYAARGFAVVQPEFRGSSGYGDDWYQKNGFQSWRLAVGDVVDAGRWLVAEGADKRRLAIVGWSYGGYAALQSAVLSGSLFKAVVAIAPVTDLVTLKEAALEWGDKDTRDFVGSGPHVREGSPLQNLDKIVVPVMLVHGTRDANVPIVHSTLFASRFKAAGGAVQLITFDGLDHQLNDSVARTKLLTESAGFLQQAFAPYLPPGEK